MLAGNTRVELERFEADLRAHFEEVLAAGKIHLQIVEKLGPPETVAEAYNAERPLEHAGFWLRLAAFLGDMALFAAMAFPIAFVAVLTESGSIPRFVGAAALVLLGLSFVGAALIYFPLSEARFGRTLGKQLMKIRVVDESGRPIRLGQAVIRRLSLFFDLTVLDSLFIPFTQKKQRGLDILARTIVVKEPGEEAPLWAWAFGFFGWMVVVGVIVAIVLPYAE